MTPPPVLGSSSYNADFDLDRDGIVSSKDVRFVQDQVGRAAVGDSISDHSVTDPSNYSSPPSGPNNILGFAGMVQGRPSTGLLLARHRWLDPKLGRWLTRDPAGYVDGSNLFEYCQTNPTVHVDPMGLENVAIDRVVASNAKYQAAVMQSFRSGEISAQDASRLIDGAMHSALGDIATAKQITNQVSTKLNASVKAIGNAFEDTIVSTVALGQVDHVGLFNVNEYEQSAGYSFAYGSARVSGELSVGIVGGELGKLGGAVGKAALVFDSARNGVFAGRGVANAYECGFNADNSSQILLGVLGLTGNVAGALHEGSIKKTLLYEIGQQGLSDERYLQIGLDGLTPIEKGQKLVEAEGGVMRALLPKGKAIVLGGSIGRLGTGPTPLGALGAGAAGGFITAGTVEYYQKEKR